MKTKILPCGSAIVLVATIGLFTTANCRIQPHGHQHGDVLGRILHKPTASSGSSIVVTATDSEHHKSVMLANDYAKRNTQSRLPSIQVPLSLQLRLAALAKIAVP